MVRVDVGDPGDAHHRYPARRLHQTLEPQEGECGYGGGVLYLAIPNHPFNLRKRDSPRYKVLLFVIEVDLARVGGDVHLITLIGVPVRLEEMSGVNHRCGN